MNKTKAVEHSPTPLPSSTWDTDTNRSQGERRLLAKLFLIQNPKIVKAVNSHEALVKSLKETANALGEYCKTHQPMSFGACCAIRKDAQAALKAAGE